MTLSIVLYDAFLRPIITGRFPTGQSGSMWLNPLDGKRHALVHEFVQVGGLPCQLRHHTNLPK